MIDDGQGNGRVVENFRVKIGAGRFHQKGRDCCLFTASSTACTPQNYRFRSEVL